MLLSWIARRQLDAFERTWSYDVTYLRDLLRDGGLQAILPLNALGKIGNYRRGVPAATYFAAKITASIDADCGACAQITVRQAERAGVDPRTITALARGDLAALPAEARLGAELARATIARDVGAANAVREEIVGRWGHRALAPLAYAIVAARAYPILKYALGYGHACERLSVGGREVQAREFEPV